VKNMSLVAQGERRPVALRRSGLARRMAHFLVVHGVSANTISFVGLAFGVGGGLLLAATGLFELQRPAFLAAVAMVLLRLLANMLDGMVALEAGQSGPVGELWNEVPDRLSDVATLIGAGYAAGSSPILGYQAACLAVLVAYVRAEGKVAGAPQVYCGPMSKPQRMFTVAAAAVLAALIPLDWQPSFSGFGLMALALLVVILGSLWTVLRRLRLIVLALPRNQK
jgi:phosphatidylglycerophosphate synthase